MHASEGINPAVLKRTAGYIYKKGGVVNMTAGRRNWKKRWFVIEPKIFEGFIGYQFKYYENANGKLKGSIDLQNVEVFCEETPSLGKITRYDFHILLENQSSLQLSCEDSRERDEWLETLNIVIAYSRKMIRAATNTLDGYDPMYEDEEQIHRVGSEIAHRCQAFGPGLFGAEVGQHAHFQIQAHDLMGNALAIGGLPFTATLADDECLYYLRVTDNNDGTYAAYYVVSRPGRYQLSILLNDEHDIYGSPFEVEILPSKALPEKCTAHGEVLLHCLPAAESVFTIVSRDTFGNQKLKGGEAFEVGVMGAAKLSSLQDNGDGSYRCAFEAQSPTDLDYYASNTLMIQVTLNGKHISGSPFRPVIEELSSQKVKPIMAKPRSGGVLDITASKPRKARSLPETEPEESIAPIENLDSVAEYQVPTTTTIREMTPREKLLAARNKAVSVASSSVAGDNDFEAGQGRVTKLDMLSARMKTKGSGGGGLLASPKGKTSSSPTQVLIDALTNNKASAGGKGLPGNLDSTNASERTMWRITAEALQRDAVSFALSMIPFL